jgi:hemoglobin
VSSEPTATPFERLGGRDAVARVIEAFYDRIEGDPELRAIFPNDLEEGREKQRLFFEQWLGGEPRYSDRYGHPMMRRRHLPHAITARAADRWIAHFTAALEECAVPPDLRETILERLRPLARHMVNTLDPDAEER